ncbi:MAG: TlpA disulfide reductase family protein [Planctomycetia bacterium]|nr:TlpA disulfide reductase family protein [Planctomycetia bacterium]
MKDLWLRNLVMLFCLGFFVALPCVCAAEDTAADAPASAEDAKDALLPELPTEGTAEDYTKYLSELQKSFMTFVRANGDDVETLQNVEEQLRERLLAASEKILEAKDATAAQYGRAVSTILNITAHTQGRKKAEEKAEELVAAAEKAGHKEVAQEIRLSIITAKIQNAETKEEFKKLITEFSADLTAEGKTLSRNEVGMIVGIVRMAGYRFDTEYALTLCKDFIDILEKSSSAYAAQGKSELMPTYRRLSLFGAILPEIEGKNLDGSELDMSEYKGKVWLLDFWATWCGPCVAEIPNVTKTYEKYHEKGFEVLSVSVDRDIKKLESFLEKKPLPWKCISDKDTKVDGGLFSEFCGVQGIPCMILIDKEGKVISTNARGAELDRLLEELLGSEE